MARRRKQFHKKKRQSKFVTTVRHLEALPVTQRSHAIAKVNRKFIHDLSSHVAKLRRRKIPSLKRFSGLLRKLSNSRVSFKRKRKLLSQKGGSILSRLLPLIVGTAIQARKVWPKVRARYNAI